MEKNSSSEQLLTRCSTLRSATKMFYSVTKTTNETLKQASSDSSSKLGYFHMPSTITTLNKKPSKQKDLKGHSDTHPEVHKIWGCDDYKMPQELSLASGSPAASMKVRG